MDQAALTIQDYILQNTSKWERRIYSVDTFLFYSGHVPYYSIVIEKGSGVMVSKGRKQELLTENTPYFFKELIQEIPLKKNVIIKAGSTVLLVDRFELTNFI